MEGGRRHERVTRRDSMARDDAMTRAGSMSRADAMTRADAVTRGRMMTRGGSITWRGSIAGGLGAALLAASLTACSSSTPDAMPGGTPATGAPRATGAASGGTARSTDAPSGATATPAGPGAAGSTTTQKPGGLQATAAPTRRPDGLPGDRRVGKVRRPGAAAGSTPPQAPTVQAPAALTGRVAYADGTTIRIVRLQRGAQTAQGPGAFPGSGFTAVELEVTAGSRPLDLSRVVVTALAGDPAVVVAPVYVQEATTRDFTGRLAASSGGAARTAGARYAFAVPAGATRLQLVVDLDDAHANAVFAGPLA